MNFEINLMFLIQSFLQQCQKANKKIRYIENEKSF